MKNLPKSSGAIFAGFITVLLLSIVTDLIVEGVGILPPATQPEAYQWWHLLIALMYRSLFAVAGGYVTATLAPDKPVRHAIILATIGTVFGTLGTMANWDKAVATSGIWYPIVLLISSPIFIWLGGKLKKQARLTTD